MYAGVMCGSRPKPRGSGVIFGGVVQWGGSGKSTGHDMEAAGITIEGNSKYLTLIRAAAESTS